MNPDNYPVAFYSFENYNTKHRFLTYWYQIKEALSVRPSSILEIGVGSGLVTAYLRSLNIKVSTLDINKSLAPDYVGSLLEISQLLEPEQFDLIICSRVLHHLEYHYFDEALEQLAYATKKYVLLTLPYDDAGLYFMFRYTSSRIRTFSISLPLTIKRFIQRKEPSDKPKRSSFWKIRATREHSLSNVRSQVSQCFEVVHDYLIPEDNAHYLALLQKRSASIPRNHT